MKILLIGFTKIKYMPYANFYIENLHENNEVHLLYWNRDEKEDIETLYKLKLHEFKLLQLDEVKKIKKIKSFLRYKKYASKLLKEEKFDFVVVMHTLPGVILFKEITRKYAGKYILDYRDVTFENNILYKSIISMLVRKSQYTFVSSDAFRKYLPSSDQIFTSHNILLESLEYRHYRATLPREVSPIRIRYWGFIRHLEINLELIRKLANDSRFEIHYHGREQDTAKKLKQFCKINKIENVYFHGEYQPIERYSFVQETDIIHNVFSNDKVMQPATSNKYYDAIVFKIPQICNCGSYMNELIDNNRIGFSFDTKNDKFGDSLFNYYQNINWLSFEKKCDEVLDKILSEYQEGKAKLNDI